MTAGKHSSHYFFAVYFVFKHNSSFVFCNHFLGLKHTMCKHANASISSFFYGQYSHSGQLLSWKSMRILLSKLVKLSAMFIASYLFSSTETQQAKLYDVLLVHLFIYPVVVFLLFQPGFAQYGRLFCKLNLIGQRKEDQKLKI